MIKIVLIIVVWFSGESYHNKLPLSEVVMWYANRGIIVEIADIQYKELPEGTCEDWRWWIGEPRDPDYAYAYVVDSKCPVWQGRVGVAFPTYQVTLLNWCSGLDVTLVHEIGHLLGAKDTYAGYDIMSPDCDQAFIKGLISVESWLEMGGASPDNVIYLGAVK